MNLTAVINLVERDLPGFAWKVGTCCVSDDAWIVPDFNHPVYGSMLKRLFRVDGMDAGSIWDNGIDIDQRPPGNPSLAMYRAYQECIALMKRAGIWNEYRAEVGAKSPSEKSARILGVNDFDPTPLIPREPLA